MLLIKEDLKAWYDELDREKQMELWKRFATYLNDFELKVCMDQVRKGRKDLFEIHFSNGYIEKYQIYFMQIMRNLEGAAEDDGCDD